MALTIPDAVERHRPRPNPPRHSSSIAPSTVTTSEKGSGYAKLLTPTFFPLPIGTSSAKTHRPVAAGLMLRCRQCLYAHVLGEYAQCLHSIENAPENAAIVPRRYCFRERHRTANAFACPIEGSPPSRDGGYQLVECSTAFVPSKCKFKSLDGSIRPRSATWKGCRRWESKVMRVTCVWLQTSDRLQPALCLFVPPIQTVRHHRNYGDLVNGGVKSGHAPEQ